MNAKLGNLIIAIIFLKYVYLQTLHYTNNGVIEFIKADDKVILQNRNKHKKQEAT